MYVRTKTFKNKDGTKRTYLYIVRSRRINGRVKQEVVANLGRLEKIQKEELDSIIDGLSRYSKKRWIQVDAEGVDAKWAKSLGRHLPKILCKEGTGVRE